MGNHHLNFAIPEQLPPGKEDRDLRPKKVQEWLGNLPRANIGLMAKQVFDLLVESNRLKIEPSARLQIIQFLYEPADYILAALEKYYIGTTLPLSPKSHKISMLAQSLLHEVVIAHKSLISDLIGTHKLRIKRDQLALIMHNQLAFSNRLLLSLYLTYTDIPKQFWREQCTLLQYAEQFSVTELAVFGSQSPWNITNRFKQSLLLATASPASLEQREIQQLYTNLSAWVSRCKLLNMDKYTPGLHSLFINLNDDKGPQHLENPDNFDSAWRIIDNTALNPILESEIEKIHNEVTSAQLHEQSLQRILKQFSQGQKRHFNRTTSDGAFTLAIGTSAIHWMLSHHIGLGERTIGKRADYESTMIASVNADDAPDVWNVYRDATTTTQLEGISNNAPVEFKTFDFDVLDESANGFRLRLKNGQEQSGLKVGELVSLHKGFNGSGKIHGLALIRWLHRTSDNTVLMGIELIAPNATPVEVGLVQGEAKSASHLMRALMLPEIPAIHQAATLVVPNTFKVGQKIALHIYDTQRLAILKKQQGRGGSHAQFQFELLEEEKPTLTPQQKRKNIENDDDNLDNVWELL